MRFNVKFLLENFQQPLLVNQLQTYVYSPFYTFLFRFVRGKLGIFFKYLFFLENRSTFMITRLVFRLYTAKILIIELCHINVPLLTSNFSILFFFQLPHYLQLPGFNSTKYNLHSGPVLVLNTNTFYVTNFFYDGGARGAHFCFDRGSQPGTCGHFARVLGDGDATENLRAFWGDNVYVRLERGVVSGVGFLAVWSSEEKKSLGHVVVPKVVGSGLDEPGFEKFTVRFIIFMECWCRY